MKYVPPSKEELARRGIVDKPEAAPKAAPKVTPKAKTKAKAKSMFKTKE
jgi:hypothetical protein